MARTESKSVQVHPYDEQSQIDLMQKFHWSLLNSQEIKTIDNRLERRGGGIYSVTNTEHYVKLTFSRDLDLPNRQLEENGDATLERHCEMWEQKRGVRISVSAMSRAIRGKLGWTYRKVAGRPPSETKGTEAGEHAPPPEILVPERSLELGMFTQRIPGLDTIGTELLDVHSPRERMNHKSVARVWPVIKDVMKSLDK